jgi:hypothetical protein
MIIPSGDGLMIITAFDKWFVNSDEKYQIIPSSTLLITLLDVPESFFRA